MDKKEVTFGGITATIKRLKVRDRLVRSAIYQKLEARFDNDPAVYRSAFEYADVCASIVSLAGCEEWTPTAPDTPDNEANKQFEAWLDLPIAIGDWLTNEIFTVPFEKKVN